MEEITSDPEQEELLSSIFSLLSNLKCMVGQDAKAYTLLHDRISLSHDNFVKVREGNAPLWKRGWGNPLPVALISWFR